MGGSSSRPGSRHTRITSPTGKNPEETVTRNWPSGENANAFRATQRAGGAPGQSPTVVANPSMNNGVAVQVTGAGLNATWKGINVVQNIAVPQSNVFM